MPSITVRPFVCHFLLGSLFVISSCSYQSAVKNPNILLLTIDTLRKDHLSCYGYEKIETPSIDRLAKEGMKFTNAVCQAPLTLPSHCSIFTGKYPPAHRVRHNGIFKLRSEEVTLAEILREHQFETGAFVGSYILNSSFGLGQGFLTYNDIKITGRHIMEARNLKQIRRPERPAEEVNEAFFRWLSSVKDKRFFAWVHYYDPHYPYDPPEQTKKKIQGKGYDREVSYADQCVGDLLKRLEEMSLLDTTLILFCSDHGESLGDHGEMAHGIFIYDGTVRIPLIIRAPWMIQKGTIYEGLFETVDIMPTLLDLIGFQSPPGIQGKSFAENIKKGKGHAGKKESYAETYMPTFEYGWSDLRSIRTIDRKYIEAPIPEMYDLIADPDEKTNLYSPSNEESQELKKEFNDFISRIAPRDSDPFRMEKIDEEKIKILKSLGYLSGGYFKGRSIDPNRKRVDPKLTIEEENIVLQAQRLMAERRWEEAVASFQNILLRNPRNYQARLSLIKVLLVMGEDQKAEEEILKAISMAEKDKTAMIALGAEIWNMHGYLLEKKKDDKGALQAYQKGYELHPDSDISFAFLAHYYISHQELDKAIQIIKEALQSNPENQLAYSYLFKIYMQKDDINAAVSMAKKLVHFDLSDDLPTLFLAGNLLKRKAMLEESILAFQQILKIQPENKEALGHLGSAYLMRRDYVKAKEKFEKILQIDPGEYKASFYLGVIALKRDDEKEARERFRQVLLLNPSYYPVYHALGQWLKDKGRTEEAKKEFRKALSLNPEDPIAIRNLKSLETSSSLP